MSPAATTSHHQHHYLNTRHHAIATRVLCCAHAERSCTYKRWVLQYIQQRATHIRTYIQGTMESTPVRPRAPPLVTLVGEAGFGLPTAGSAACAAGVGGTRTSRTGSSRLMTDGAPACNNGTPVATHNKQLKPQAVSKACIDSKTLPWLQLLWTVPALLTFVCNSQKWGEQQCVLACMRCARQRRRIVWGELQGVVGLEKGATRQHNRCLAPVAMTWKIRAATACVGYPPCQRHISRLPTTSCGMRLAQASRRAMLPVLTPMPAA